jgi:anthraniloyl-CoA monooxygenase
LGRPLLLDPNFVRHAQAYEQIEVEDIPNQYKSAQSPLYSLKASERKMVEGMKKALKPESHKK